MKLLSVSKSLLPSISLVFGFGALVGGVQAQSNNDGSFGTFLYSEASDATRAEMLDLLDREDPTVGIFAHALSMGLPVDELLEAATRNNVDKGQQYYSAAGFMLPLLNFNPKQSFDKYSVEDLENRNSASEVITKFFDDRAKIEFQPDWHTGEYHMLVPVSELKKILDDSASAASWYIADNVSTKPSPSRPVFIQLYSDISAVLINDAEKINRVFATRPNATLPVVFAFNTTAERPVSRMTQPSTVKSIIDDYYTNGTMVTPPPEWDLREYHVLASIDQIEEVFTIPNKDDIADDRWQAITRELEKSGLDESFVVTIIPGGNLGSTNSRSSNGLDSGIEVLGEGAVMNRLDRVAVAKSLGFTEFPVSFYYIDNQRVKPFKEGLPGLAYISVQAGMSPASLGFAGVGSPGTTGVPGGRGGFGNPPTTPTPPTVTPPTTPTPTPTPPVAPPPPSTPVCPSPPCSN